MCAWGASTPWNYFQHPSLRYFISIMSHHSRQSLIDMLKIQDFMHWSMVQRRSLFGSLLELPITLKLGREEASLGLRPYSIEDWGLRPYSTERLGPYSMETLSRDLKQDLYRDLIMWEWASAHNDSSWNEKYFLSQPTLFFGARIRCPPMWAGDAAVCSNTLPSIHTFKVQTLAVSNHC